jgi:hypothetical protein
VPRIERIQWMALGEWCWRETSGVAVAVWPSPVDDDACLRRAGIADFADSNAAWEADFAMLLDDVVSLLSRFGVAQVHGVEPVPTSLSDRLLRRNTPPSEPAWRLALAAGDDQFGTCDVELGNPVRAVVCTSDGHPIIWIWTDAQIETGWPKYLAPLTRGRPLEQGTIKIGVLSLPNQLRPIVESRR